jgi:hypothetical protein
MFLKTLTGNATYWQNFDILVYLAEMHVRNLLKRLQILRLTKKMILISGEPEESTQKECRK